MVIAIYGHAGLFNMTGEAQQTHYGLVKSIMAWLNL